MSGMGTAPEPIRRPLTHGTHSHLDLPATPSALSLEADVRTFLFGPGVKPGKFGRMFRRLRPLDAPDAVLIALGQAMIEPAGAFDAAGDNPKIPAGFTYLGPVHRP